MEEKNVVSGGAKALAVLLCIVATVLLAFALVVMGIQGSFSKGGIKKMIKSSAEASEVFGEASGQLTYMLEAELGVDADDLDALEDTFADMAADLAAYSLTGKGDPINVSKVMKEIKKQAKKIEKEADVDIDSDMLDEIEDYLEDANDDFKDMMEYASQDDEFKMIRGLMSPMLYLIPLVIAIALFAAVFAMLKAAYRGMSYTGVTCIVSGVLVLLVGLLLTVLKNTASESEEFVGIMVGTMGGKVIANAIFAMVVGIVLKVVSGNLKKSAQA